LAPQGLRSHLEWFRTLPIWLDLDGLRVVHACWDERTGCGLRNYLQVGELCGSALTNNTRGDNANRSSPADFCESAGYSFAEPLRPKREGQGLRF
jgi:hypothetical protein